MKNFKKLFAMLMIAMLILGLGITASAEDYSIKISNAVAGKEYRAYKIFDATKSSSGTSYSYTISTDSEWFDAVMTYMGYTKDGSNWTKGGTVQASPFEGSGLKLTLSGDGTKYVVTWTEVVFSAADFAEYLKANLGSKTLAASETATDVVVNLDVTASGAGYYFVNSTMGSVCSLDTVVGTDQNIIEKNNLPALDKLVEEDSTGIYGRSATADIGQEVNFKLTVHSVETPASVLDDFVIIDTLPGTMTYVADSVSITGWTLDTDYSVSYDNATKVLTITLKKTKLSTLGNKATVDVSYRATLDDTAIVGDPGNINKAHLEYDSIVTADVEATVYTYGIGGGGTTDFQKVDGDGTTPLQGVKFILSKVEGSKTYYAKLTNSYTYYYLYEWTENKAEATSIETNSSGTFYIYGLDAGSYTLIETETLPGYNLLDDTITVNIDGAGSVTYKLTKSGSAESSITVVNNTGKKLPSTGGIGTTIFYVVGSVLVIGTAVLLITRKRMNNVQ